VVRVVELELAVGEDQLESLASMAEAKHGGDALEDQLEGGLEPISVEPPAKPRAR
jgi:hypothetical protein